MPVSCVQTAAGIAATIPLPAISTATGPGRKRIKIDWITFSATAAATGFTTDLSLIGYNTANAQVQLNFKDTSPTLAFSKQLIFPGQGLDMGVTLSSVDFGCTATAMLSLACAWHYDV